MCLVSWQWHLSYCFVTQYLRECASSKWVWYLRPLLRSNTHFFKVGKLSEDISTAKHVCRKEIDFCCCPETIIFLPIYFYELFKVSSGYTLSWECASLLCKLCSKFFYFSTFSFSHHHSVCCIQSRGFRLK